MDREFVLNLINAELQYNQEPEANLMRAVIKQAFLDYLIISTNYKYRSKKRLAREWFETNSEEFKLVCLIAQVKYSRIIEIYSLITLLKNEH